MGKKGSKFENVDVVFTVGVNEDGNIKNICDVCVCNLEIAKLIELGSIIEIKYYQIQIRKSGDIYVREPTFKRIRPDKKIEDISTMKLIC